MIHEEQFKFEVNEIAFNPDSNLFFITNGQVSILYKFNSPDKNKLERLSPQKLECLVKGLVFQDGRLRPNTQSLYYASKFTRYKYSSLLPVTRVITSDQMLSYFDDL